MDQESIASPFDTAVFEARWHKLRQGMERADIGALIVASEPELQYLTGFRPPLMVSSARPWFAVLGRHGKPIIGAAALAEAEAIAAPAKADVMTWRSPQRTEGLDALVAAIEAASAAGSVACALGDHTRLGLPANWLDHLRRHCSPQTLADSSDLLWRSRMIKEPREVALIGEAARAAQVGFDTLATDLQQGMSEREAARLFAAAAFKGGADDIGYIAASTGAGGYATLIDRPTDTRIAERDIFGLDAGGRVGGYWCDYNRNFAVGEPGMAARKAAMAVVEAARIGIEQVRPGVKASEIWHVMAKSLAMAGYVVTPHGRLGHGVGLEFTEHPSLAANDQTVIEPGMVLSIEPVMAFGEGKIMSYEEMISVGTDAVTLLTQPSADGLMIVSG